MKHALFFNMLLIALSRLILNKNDIREVLGGRIDIIHMEATFYICYASINGILYWQ
jgi:hypothetical protein